MRCLLAAGQPDNYVAEGTVHAVGGKGMTLHNMDLPLDFVKVSVDMFIKSNAQVSCQNDDVELVIDALRIFLAWPRDYVTHDMDVSNLKILSMWICGFQTHKLPIILTTGNSKTGYRSHN